MSNRGPRGPAFSQRCWVPGCRHNKLEDKQNLTVSLFRFPCGNVARCRAWLKVLGLEPFLTLSPRQLNNKFICEEHFRDYELRRYNLKTTLVTSAIPSNVPPGVCPLSDELVERWPPQKENQSAEEKVNLSLQKKIQSDRAPLANHVEDKSNADGMEFEFSSSDSLAKRVGDEHNYSSSIHLDSRASNSIPVVAPGAEQGFNSWAPSSVVCQIGNRLFAITGHSIEIPEKYNASGRELDFSPSDSLAKHVEDEHNSSSIHLDSSASNSIPVVPGAEQGFNCWTPSSLVCDIGLLDCLL